MSSVPLLDVFRSTCQVHVCYCVSNAPLRPLLSTHVSPALSQETTLTQFNLNHTRFMLSSAGVFVNCAPFTHAALLN